MGFLDLRGFYKLMEPYARRILLMITRGVFLSTYQKGGRTYAKARSLDGEILEDIEVFQQYGFASRPKSGADGILGSITGDRSHTAFLGSEDKRYQPEHENGESITYTWLDKTSGGHRIHLKNDRSIQMQCAELRIVAGASTFILNSDGAKFITPSGEFEII
jgi:phage gp45-like